MKRFLLILASIVVLILAGSALANIPLASHRERSASAPVAPSHHNPPVPSRHRHATDRAPRRLPRAVRHRAVHRTAAEPRTQSRTLAAPGRYLLLDPSAAAPGTTVSVQGGGFAPGAALHLAMQGPGQASLARANVTARPDGSFRTTITVPARQTAPAATLVAQDALGHSTAATLLQRYGQPLAGIAPNVVTPGKHVALWIANFRPGETVRVYAGRLAGRPLFTATAGGDGRGSWPLTVPYGPGGANQLVVIGGLGHIPVVTRYLLLNLYPHAGVSSYAPQPGTRVTFYGGGFGPGEPVTLHLDRPDGPVLAVARTNAHGGLPPLGPYRVPFGLSGPHTFIVRGVNSHVMAPVGVILEPFFASARPSTYAAGPGTLITFYGGGFAPHEIVRVYVGRTVRRAGSEVAALRTTARGQLVAGSGSYVLPATVHGSTLSFALIGHISGAMAWTSLRYLAPPGTSVLIGHTTSYQPPARQHTPTTPASGSREPLLVATPPRAVTGGRVALWGTGFRPHAVVQLVLASRAHPQGWALGATRSSAQGTLNTRVTVPTWVRQADVVRGYSGAGNASFTARAALEIWPALPHLVPSTYSGTAGTVYGLGGDGFAPGEQASLYLDSIATPPLVSATSSGGHVAFAGLHIPVATAGTHTVVVKGTHGDVATVPFTELPFTPFLLLSTYSSLPERPVSVGGQGFAPGETVHLFVGADGGTFVGGVTADDRGALHATTAFTIPTTARGPFPVVAVGSVSGRPARAVLNVRPFEPALWLSGYAGHPGATVAFTGTGFARDDALSVYPGDATVPAARFRAHQGAFARAGAVRIAFGTRGGMLLLTVRGARSDTRVTLRYFVIPFTPGAGFEVRRRRGVTRLRLGAGGFAPRETVRLYRGTGAEGVPIRLLHADAAGNLPLLPVLQARGVPRVRLAYTLVGVQSGARATALYRPPRPRKARQKIPRR